MTSSFNETVYEIEDEDIHGWSASGLLTTPNFDATPIIHHASGIPLDCTFPKGGYYTLQFNLSYANVPANAQVAVRALAEISWFVEGNLISRRMHVMSGSCISGIGQSVKVRLRDDSLLGEAAVEPLPTPFQYFATMVVVPGSRPGQTQPLYLPAICTQKTLNAGQIDTIDVPSEAGIDEFYIQTRGLNLNTDALNFKVHSEPMVCEFDGHSVNRWIPIMPGSRRLVITNDTSDDIKYSVFFGIEG